MNLTIAKDQILNGLQAEQNIVTSRTTLPVLSNVLLRAEGSRLELTATDLDVTISSSVEAGVKKPGATTVPVKKLFGIIRELGAAEVEMETDDKNVTSVRAGSSFFKIRGLGAEEYPPLPHVKDDKKVTLPQEKIRGMLKKTSFAMSAAESRHVLNGIFMSHISEKSQGEFIVPAKAVSELNRLLQEQGEVEVKFTENQAAFRLSDEKGLNIALVTKLIEGSYPNYRQVIPPETKERITLGREEFLHALRRAEIMTSEKQNSVKLSFTKNSLAITANSPDVGEARELLAINYKGKEMAIAFNPGYVIDPLNALTGDEVFFELIDELSPGILKTNGPFLYVVMPMRLS